MQKGLAEIIVVGLILVALFWIYLISGKPQTQNPPENMSITSLPTSSRGTPESTPKVSITTSKVNTDNKLKVLLLIYNPKIEQSGGNKLTRVKNWNDPIELSNKFIKTLSDLSNGFVKYEIVETLEKDEYPTKRDDFIYTDETYLACISDFQKCHLPDIDNYQKIILDVAACEKLNRGEIDELWMWGGPYFGFYEANLAGPSAFWYNSPPTTRTSCQKLLPIMGFSYERIETEMLENYAHRMEATMTKVYGSWGTNEDHPWNRFTLLDVDKGGRGGCGNAHLAVNAGKNTGYDQTNPRVVSSFCDDFLNYPNLTGLQTQISCNTWGCTSQGYLRWWFQHIPRAVGETEGKLNNWWIYVSNPQMLTH